MCRYTGDTVSAVSDTAVQLHPGCVAGGRHHFGRLRSHRLHSAAETLARQQYVYNKPVFGLVPRLSTWHCPHLLAAARRAAALCCCGAGRAAQDHIDITYPPSLQHLPSVLDAVGWAAGMASGLQKT